MKAFRNGKLSWLFLFAFLLVASALSTLVLRLERNGFFRPSLQIIGHITHAYGTVTRTHSTSEKTWGRLETGRSILEPLALGDQVQTGDDSAAEILFYGGAVLKLDAGAVMRFEDDGDNVSMRVILGQAFLEYPLNTSGNHFVFRKNDGSLAEYAHGKKLVLTLSAVEELEDAVDVQVMDGAASEFAAAGGSDYPNRSACLRARVARRG